jgi:hypothetical protein
LTHSLTEEESRFPPAHCRTLLPAKSGFLRVVTVGKERRFNPRFLMLMDHYLVEPEACTPAAGWEKGQVEKQVQDIRRRFFAPRRKAESLDALNQELMAEIEAYITQHKHPTIPGKTVSEVFEEEKSQLRPLATPFSGYVEREVRSSSTCLVNFDSNHYSIDSRYANHHVTLRIYAQQIEVYANQNRVASHIRLFGKDKTQYDPWHYLSLLERKPGALRNGAPFQQWELPPSINKVQQRLLSRKGGDREMVNLLLAAHQDGIDLLEQACQWMLQQQVISSALILNKLQRLREPPPEPPVKNNVIPLQAPPHADCARYNELLSKGERHGTK